MPGLMYYAISWLLWLLELVFIAMVNGECMLLSFQGSTIVDMSFNKMQF
jgi:hypothetical protein